MQEAREARALFAPPPRAQPIGMSDIAVIEQPRAAIAPKPNKPTRISPRLRQAIELLETGTCETQRAAAERAGLGENWLSKALGKAEIQAFIADRTRKKISTAGLARAGNRVVELIDADSEHVSLDASKHVLAIAGISPPDNRAPMVNISITPGYVIDLGGERPRTNTNDIKTIDEAKR